MTGLKPGWPFLRHLNTVAVSRHRKCKSVCLPRSTSSTASSAQGNRGLPQILLLKEPHTIRVQSPTTMALITYLPVDILLEIMQTIPEEKDLSSFSRCSRSMHILAFKPLFDRAFRQQSARSSPKSIFVELILHAIKNDSQDIMNWIACHKLRAEFNG